MVYDWSFARLYQSVSIHHSVNRQLHLRSARLVAIKSRPLVLSVWTAYNVCADKNGSLPAGVDSTTKVNEKAFGDLSDLPRLMSCPATHSKSGRVKEEGKDEWRFITQSTARPCLIRTAVWYDDGHAAAVGFFWCLTLFFPLRLFSLEARSSKGSTDRVISARLIGFRPTENENNVASMWLLLAG